MAGKPAGQYEESNTGKLLSKSKDAPFVPLGIAGMVGMVAYGAYSFKKRGDMSPSIFFMHLRVKAQSMVVGAMTLGVVYMLAKDYVFDKEGHKRELEAMDAKARGNS